MILSRGIFRLENREENEPGLMGNVGSDGFVLLVVICGKLFVLF